jgi:hypothetical protein
MQFSAAVHFSIQFAHFGAFVHSLLALDAENGCEKHINYAHQLISIGFSSLFSIVNIFAVLKLIRGGVKCMKSHSQSEMQIFVKT